MALKRVDDAMVAHELASTVEMARLLIMEGRVYMGENKVNKPSDAYKPLLPLTVRPQEKIFVSRGAYKLKKALEAFCIDITSQVCMDVGASTGGFTDIMLRAGAKKVYAIDVGYGQLDWKLRSDERVAVMERTNARFLAPEQFEPRPTFGATDVSFISLRAVLPAVLGVLSGNTPRFVALIKPQFEANKDQVGAKGVVRDIAVHREVVRGIVSYVQTIGWVARDVTFSPIKGPEGNIEFLIDLVPISSADQFVTDCKIIEIISAAYDILMKSSECTCI